MEASRAQRGLVVSPELPSEDTVELTLQPRAGPLQRLRLYPFLPQTVQIVFSSSSLFLKTQNSFESADASVLF